jgi:heat shock protein HslJ
MRAKSLMLAVLAVFGLHAAALAQAADPYAALIGTRWRATEIAGAPVDAPLNPTLAFNGNGLIAGRGACNSYTAQYTPDPADPDRRRIVIRGTGWTKMACHGTPGQIDFKYGQALERTRRFEAAPAALTGYDQAGAVTLRFAPDAAPKQSR